MVRWACRAGTRDFCPALAALVGPVQNMFFPLRAIAHAATWEWAGSRAGLPVSEYGNREQERVSERKTE